MFCANVYGVCVHVFVSVCVCVGLRRYAVAVVQDWCVCPHHEHQLGAVCPGQHCIALILLCPA